MEKGSRPLLCLPQHYNRCIPSLQPMDRCKEAGNTNQPWLWKLYPTTTPSEILYLSIIPCVINPKRLTQESLWPYDFISSPYYLNHEERGSVTGRLFVQDR